jgi:hypothetical protein
MAEVIFHSEHGTATGPVWVVTRQPGETTNPYLVEFVKRGRNGKLLQQTAEWHWIANRWCEHRWFPKLPTVPKWLIARVEAHMRQVKTER